MAQISARSEHSAQNHPPVVVVSGEIDPASAARLASFLVANYARHETVKLDLGETTFADCALLRVLETEHVARAAHGGTVNVVKTSEAVRRLLLITDTEQFLSDVSLGVLQPDQRAVSPARAT